MYKDKDRQKEASRERQRRYKAKQKALLNQGVTEQKALLNQGVTEGVTLRSMQATEVEYLSRSKPANYGQPDCQCRHCQNNRRSGNKYTLNHGPYKKLAQLGTREYNRVSLPGDPDYTPEHSVGVPK